MRVRVLVLVLSVFGWGSVAINPLFSCKIAAAAEGRVGFLYSRQVTDSNGTKKLILKMTSWGARTLKDHLNPVLSSLPCGALEDSRVECLFGWNAQGLPMSFEESNDKSNGESDGDLDSTNFTYKSWAAVTPDSSELRVRIRGDAAEEIFKFLATDPSVKELCLPSITCGQGRFRRKRGGVYAPLQWYCDVRFGERGIVSSQ